MIKYSNVMLVLSCQFPLICFNRIWKERYRNLQNNLVMRCNTKPADRWRKFVRRLCSPKWVTYWTRVSNIEYRGCTYLTLSIQVNGVRSQTYIGMPIWNLVPEKRYNSMLDRYTDVWHPCATYRSDEVVAWECFRQATCQYEVLPFAARELVYFSR